MSKICMPLSSIENPDPNDGVLGVGFAAGMFTREECNQIINISNNLDSSAIAETLGSEEASKPVKRDSEVIWLAPRPDTTWVYEKMEAAIRASNRNYKFELYGFENFQVATYREGGYYDWHMDLGKGPASTRKLGISLQLSDSGDYEGGDIEFRDGGVPPSAPRRIGTLVVFPAFMPHRIAQVTRGIRKSLVAWVHGIPFR